ncbi:MAG: hypothetical protein WAN74_06805 [Thermoplasmata archaeon]
MVANELRPTLRALTIGELRLTPAQVRQLDEDQDPFLDPWDEDEDPTDTEPETQRPLSA